MKRLGIALALLLTGPAMAAERAQPVDVVSERLDNRVLGGGKGEHELGALEFIWGLQLSSPDRRLSGITTLSFRDEEGLVATTAGGTRLTFDLTGPLLGDLVGVMAVDGEESPRPKIAAPTVTRHRLVDTADIGDGAFIGLWAPNDGAAQTLIQSFGPNRRERIFYHLHQRLSAVAALVQDDRVIVFVAADNAPGQPLRLFAFRLPREPSR